MDEHYQTLGVSKTATQDEIKQAYRRLASKHHPDKGGDTAMFQKVQAAYDVLGDPEKRRNYDNPPAGPEFHFDPGGGGFGSFEDILRGFGGFEHMFGNGFHRSQNRQPKNSTISIQTTITLEEAFAGKELLGNIQLPSGKEQFINAKIPAGIAHESVINLKGLGDDRISGVPRGDIHVTVLVNPHHVFDRRGDDLVTQIDIDALDAILGTEYIITTIEGKALNVTIPPGTQPNTTLSLQGHGMPNVHDNRFRGRLLLKINVVIPTKLTDSQRELIKQAKS